ncbi:hypothetical protein [Brevundimonas aurantiaca]|uniref:hypothetical protein n=1 Tax=Brevundimonas aurantiaca TaxID=74316 RepID=UPI001D181C55|nr:hypothetical protein [Brevundimonas aurantiaca]MCC4295803.1 hypothetical protein [Brevundimonas aurantiaca]
MTDHIVEANKKVIDLDALEKLADRCSFGDPWYTEENLLGRQNFGQFLTQDRAFIAAANPATIKALIAELKEARATIVTIDEFCRDSIHSTEMLMSNPPQNIVAYAVGKLVRAFLARNGADT